MTAPAPTTAPTRAKATPGPLEAEPTVTDADDHLVTLTLGEHARRRLVADLADRHMRDLVCLARLREQARRARRDGMRAKAVAIEQDASTVESRLTGDLASRATAQWELDPDAATILAEDIDHAAGRPEICLAGTCTSLSLGSGYCPGHAGA